MHVKAMINWQMLAPLKDRDEQTKPQEEVPSVPSINF